MPCASRRCCCCCRGVEVTCFDGQSGSNSPSSRHRRVARTGRTGNSAGRKILALMGGPRRPTNSSYPHNQGVETRTTGKEDYGRSSNPNSSAISRIRVVQDRVGLFFLDNDREGVSLSFFQILWNSMKNGWLLFVHHPEAAVRPPLLPQTAAELLLRERGDNDQSVFIIIIERCCSHKSPLRCYCYYYATEGEECKLDGERGQKRDVMEI